MIRHHSRELVVDSVEVLQTLPREHLQNNFSKKRRLAPTLPEVQQRVRVALGLHLGGGGCVPVPWRTHLLGSLEHDVEGAPLGSTTVDGDGDYLAFVVAAGLDT